MNIIRPLAGLAMLLLAAVAAAQSPRTEHTYRIDDPDHPPPATLADAAMLVGSWTGTAFGGTFEQVWNPPSAGSMIGFFKLMREGKVSFYEILLLKEEQGTLSLKVRHFGDDFSAWEEKDEFIDFRFAKAEDDAIHFQGISFYRVREDEMHGYIVMRNGDEIREEKLVYRRTVRTGMP
jgi:hypothetical protein